MSALMKIRMLLRMNRCLGSRLKMPAIFASPSWLLLCCADFFVAYIRIRANSICTSKEWKCWWDCGVLYRETISTMIQGIDLRFFYRGKGWIEFYLYGSRAQKECEIFNKLCFKKPLTKDVHENNFYIFLFTSF